MVDFKGSLGSIPRDGVLYKAPVSGEKRLTPQWSGATALHTEEPAQKNEFLKDLENEDVDLIDEDKDVGRSSQK